MWGGPKGVVVGTVATSHCCRTEINYQQGFEAATFTRLNHSVFITRIPHKCVWMLKPSGGHQGIPFPYCLLAALCVCQRCNPDSGTTGTLRYCCLINYVRGRKYKSLDTSGTVFKRAALLWEETLALIKRHTFISAACNGGFHSCQRRAPDAGGYASQRPLRNKNCLIPFQLV